MVTQTTCGHFNHLFAHPFCSSQPLFKRATNIAVLCMIGVVAAIVASKIFKRPLISLFGYQYPRAEKPFAIPSGLCAEAQKAMEFAEKALKENPNAKSTLSRTTFQPSKPIAQLVDLYWSTFNKHYVEALKSNLDAPYDSEDMLKAADEYLKIAYAISLLTLEDHEDFCESITERSKKQYFTYRNREMSIENVLTSQSSYQYRTYFYVSIAYSRLRGPAHYTQKDPSNKGNATALQYKYQYEKTNTDYHQKFYEEGTCQAKWRLIYNDFCQQVCSRTDIEKLKRADQRFVNWIPLDEDINTFKVYPDTLPT